jgi:hypothetical protein
LVCFGFGAMAASRSARRDKNAAGNADAIGSAQPVML